MVILCVIHVVLRRPHMEMLLPPKELKVRRDHGMVLRRLRPQQRQQAQPRNGPQVRLSTTVLATSGIGTQQHGPQVLHPESEG